MASRNNRSKSGSVRSSTATRATTATRKPVNKVTAKPVAARPAATRNPVLVVRDPVRVATAPVRRREPVSLHSMVSNVNRREPRKPTPRPPDPPATPSKPRAGRASNLRLQTTVKTRETIPAKRAKTVTPKKSTSKVSSATPRDDKIKVTCKARPDNNKPSSKGGGGGSMKRFIPWCG